MAFVNANPNNETVQKFLEDLQSDFRTLANETKKKYPQIKEVWAQLIKLSKNVSLQWIWIFIAISIIFWK